MLHGFRKFNVLISLTLLIAGPVFMVQLGWLDDYAQSVLMLIGINILLSTSLNLVNGFMGEFSCGHAGFMAVGAYAASLLSNGLFFKGDLFATPILSDAWIFLCFPIIIALGGVAAALVSLVVAIPSFKTRGDYLAVITLAASFVIKNLFENFESIGGPRGMMGMKQVETAMQAVVPLPWMLVWVGLAAFSSVWLMHRFVTSTYGKSIVAIHQDELAAEMMGIPTNRMKFIVFMLSSAFAGVAGGLYAHVIGYVNPGSFSVLKSTECLIMVYLGGMGSLSGSVLSAIVFTLLLELLRPLQIIKWIVLPLLLVLLMRFRPEGIMGNREISDVWPWWRRAKRS